MNTLLNTIKSLLYKPFTGALVALMMVCSNGWATDVKTEASLKEAVARGDSYIRLTDNISIGSTLSFTSGNIVLDLAGKELSYKQVNNNATCILVNGNASLTIIGGGTISAQGVRGDWNFGKYTAISLSYKGGDVKIHTGKFQAHGEKGSSYTLDPDIHTVNEMIPYGAYMTNSSAYGSTGLESSSTTVALTTYNVTYNLNNSSQTIVGSSYTIETTNFTLPTAEKNGYTLNGWKYNNSVVDVNNLPTTTERQANTNISFDADWKAITYKINYNANGGSSIAEGSYTIETDNLTLPTPTLSGYRFVGWYASLDFSGSAITAIPKGSYGNKTYYAKWSQIYTITYHGDGGTMPQAYPKEYVTEDDVTLPTPTKANNTFRGWFDNSSFTGTPVTTIAKSATGNKTYYAKWLQSYKISYVLNEGTNAENPPVSFTTESDKITLPTATRIGYDFAGWYRNIELTGSKETEIAKGSTSDRTYYAKWTPVKYTLTYNLDGGNSPDNTPATYTIEEAITLPKPSKDHYDFGGWFSNEQLAGTAVTVIQKGSTGNNTYYAKWTPFPYTITFNTNGGSVLSELSYTIDKETFLLPVKTTKVGCTLVGWYKDAALTQPYGQSVTKGTSGNFTLYAKWTLTEYVIEYNCYNGTNPADAKKEFTVEDEITLPTPSRSGFTFMGWHLSDLLDDEVQTLITKGTVGNKKYFAKWTAGNSVQITRPESGTISVKDGTVEVKSGDRVGVNSSLVVTATPSVANYRLSKLIINNKEYTTSPQTVTMPVEGGLTISATFADPRPAVSKPRVTTDPTNTDYIPVGESVKVILEKTDTEAELLYSLDGSTPKVYTGSFQVSSLSVKTMVLSVIARKEGYKDGLATRDIIFRKGKVTISFNLPKGITAHNPEGGEVVLAVASGGTFEFKLTVDKNYFEPLDTIKVLANEKAIEPDIFGIYSLTNLTANVAIKVSGITGVTHTVTLKQSANGRIFFTDDEGSSPLNANHGDNVSVTAEANEDYKFLSWTDGSQANPRVVTVEKDTTLQARFTSQDPGFSIILPEIEGVAVNPLTGYPMEVKRGGTFKFYLRMKEDYSQSVPVVYANGEKLTIYKDVYSLYNISSNMVVSVSGIQQNTLSLSLPDSVLATNLETGADATKEPVFSTTMVSLYVRAPQGKAFSKWNDGKADNPRIVAAKEASQLFPLFVSATGNIEGKVILPALVGAGIGAVNANIDAVSADGSIQLKLVILPQYSQSEVKVTANGQELTAGLSLRSSLETKTLFYNLTNVTKDVEVKVTGLKPNNYIVSLKQNDGGTVKASQIGSLKHGTVITLTATPASGKMFMKWDDGNTLNPYSYTITDNCVLSAQFIASDLPVGNETVQVSTTRVYGVKNTLYIETESPTQLSVWNYGGLQVKTVAISGGKSMHHLPEGEYIVKVGNDKPVKVSLR